MPIASIIGGIISKSGADAAGNAAGAAGSQAWQNAQAEATKARVALEPWRATGVGAENELAQLSGLGFLDWSGNPTGGPALNQSDRAQKQQEALGRFKTSPGYSFRVQEGTNALDRSAASRGMLLSGAQTKALEGFRQGLASDEYGKYQGQLNLLASGGINAATSGNNTAASLINNGNNLQMAGSLQQAKSYSDGANALAGGISKGVSNLGSIFSFNPYGMFGKI